MPKVFLYVPLNAVHGPLNEPPRYADQYYVRSAMLKCLDDAVGRILDAIDAQGFRDNTLVIFTNDNGPVLEEMSKPYRGTKNTTFEGGVRVPCILRWPGHTQPGSTTGEMMFIADFFSTFITLAGGDHEQALPVDSIDMTLPGDAKPAMAGAPSSWTHEPCGNRWIRGSNSRGGVDPVPHLGSTPCAGWSQGGRG